MSRLFRVQVFQGPGLSWSRFFRAQVFQSPGFSGSGSRFQVQVLEKALSTLINYFHFYETHVIRYSAWFFIFLKRKILISFNGEGSI